MALKIIDITAIDDDLSEIQRELSFQAHCDSDYVTKYYGSYLRGTDLWIIMEYMGTGSALDLVRTLARCAGWIQPVACVGLFFSHAGTYCVAVPPETGRCCCFGGGGGGTQLKAAQRTGAKLSEEQVRVIISGTLHGLAYLHGSNKLHRDVKAANVLVSTEGDVKLADFGVAAELQRANDTRSTVAGTPLWMAPEDYGSPVRCQRARVRRARGAGVGGMGGRGGGERGGCRRWAYLADVPW